MRNKRIERLFDEGLSVAKIAGRTGLSERQIYRLKKAWLDRAWLREMGTVQKTAPTPDGMPESPQLKECRGCRRKVVRQGEYCDVCRKYTGISDGEVYVPESFPFAYLDRNF